LGVRISAIQSMVCNRFIINGELFGRNLMAKSKKKAETVFLVCDETGDHNYTLRRKPGGEKLKLSKFSPRLRKHTMHTEKKK
jgi:large subunit ribosomal protein L33